MIDLRSDTLTKPTPEMLAAMAAAEVGDEQYREDPTVNELQRRMAELLGHEAALFLPTATMANQVALRAQTTPGSTLLAEERTHVMVYEAGGPAIHSGLVMRSLPGEEGRLSVEQIETEPELVLPEGEWVRAETLVDQLEHIAKWPREHWKLAFQGQIRPVSEHDAQVLVARLSAAARSSVSAAS